MKIRPMSKIVLLTLIFIMLSAFVPQENNNMVPPPLPPQLSDRVTEYHIHVSLDADNKQLHGSQVVTWTHPGEQAVHELYFHLYPNAFASDKTSFMRESGGKLRTDSMKKGSYGHMQITALQTIDGEDLYSRLSYVQPDDGNKDDHTLMKLRLTRPVLPGEQITLQLKFHVSLPYIFARMGYAEDFVMAGQWFPKLAAYEKAGTRERKQEGWSLHQYHGNSEFYANFASYAVQIQVPSDYIVAATGFPTRKTSVENNVKTYTFYAEDVHDFAWAASPSFIYAEEPFSTPQIPGVKIKLYLDPMHAHLEQRYLYAAKRSLAQFSKWFGSYPYSTLSIVVPPGGANGAGGMEYPTLITAWAAEEEQPGFELERVVVHEIAHQYFYGLVATNEFEEAWLDEAFTSYAEEMLMKQEYGVSSNADLEASYVTSPAPLQQFAWKYNDHDHYAENVYLRGKLVLQDIAQTIGANKMEQVLHSYFQRWKFRHPSTRSFQTVLEQVTKRSWQDYFEAYVYGGQMVDYSVEAIEVRPMLDSGNVMYESRVLFQKNDGTYSRVPLSFQFTDGKRIHRIWNGADEQLRVTFTHEAPLQWAAIDVDHSIMLENKHINNFMNATIEPKHKVRLNLGIVQIIEAFLAWVIW